ncbi:DMT family transporter [Pseudaestuariivita sp.]|uniref:DMT family transporter n=1 Tax=Pseudaestuariivita sp. TaxID=2211669 RepID=UPI004058D99E
MNRAQALAALLTLGAGWGLSIPLAKVAVSTGYQPLGLIFWQFAIGAVALGVILFVQRRLAPLLRAGRAQVAMWVLIALIGTLLPNSASYTAAVHLPGGVLSIVIATVPMFAFPIAVLLGNDRFGWTRLTGLVCGLVGVILLAAPGAGAVAAALSVWVLVALIAPIFYGVEGNVVARFGTAGMDAVQVLFGASVVGVILSLPLVLWSGQWIDPRGPYTAADGALVLSSLVHALVYAGYVSLVGRAGPVFAAQASYLVTLFGVIWSMLLLGERYQGALWLALAVMLLGLFLVQPREVRRGLVGR